MRSCPGRRPRIRSGTCGLSSFGEYLCEVRAKQYWRLENLKSFDEFLEKRFPESRRKAYYLMAIHENLTRIPKPSCGRSAGAKRRNGQGSAAGMERNSIVQPGCTKRKKCRRRDSKRSRTASYGERDGALGDDLLQAIQEPVAGRRASARNRRSDAGQRQISRLLLEMICADFLAGARLQDTPQ